MKRIKMDLGSAYPNMAKAFCLSPENYIDHSDMIFHEMDINLIEEDINKGYSYWSKQVWGKYCVDNNIIPVAVRYRQSIEELKKIKDYENCDFDGVQELRGIYYFKQNPNAILCKAFEAPMKWKQEVKKELKAISEDDPLHKITEQKYDSTKRLGNSGFGISGNKYNRLFKIQIFNSITFLVRDLLLFLQPMVIKRGWRIIFIDTDSFVIEAEDESVVKTLNGWIQDWAMDKYGNSKVDIRFEYEGSFITLYVGGKCRYMGYLLKPNGEVKEEIRGLEIRRKNATKFQKTEQKVFLKYLLEGHTLDEITFYIREWIKRIYQAQLVDIGFPKKIAKPRDQYGNVAELFKALDNTQKIRPSFVKEIGEKFWIIPVTNESEVLAFDEKNLDLIPKEIIDYPTLIEKQIFNILVPVFAGLNWGKELLALAEEFNIMLGSAHRNTLLEEYPNYDELKVYYSANATKKRKNPPKEKVKKEKKVKLDK